MSENIFLDVNIFMYASGNSHVYKQPCINILNEVESGNIIATINTEILQELLYRYYYIKLPEKGIELCNKILKYSLTILPVTKSDMVLAIETFNSSKEKGIKPRDCIHAATMKNNEISRLISADKDFDNINFVTRIDPIVYNTF